MKGLYRHFKGNLYEVLDLATDANTEETIVIYRPVGTERLWTRTLANFQEVVERDGKTFTRFERVEQAP